MRVGYSYWGFISDYKLEGGQHISAPDGNATYSWALIHALQEKGHEVWAMQKDRDREAFQWRGSKIFADFSQHERLWGYQRMRQTHGHLLPELDVLLVEWRFPIPGRNCSIDADHPGEITLPNPQAKDSWMQVDLARQYQIIEHYKAKGTKIVIWDLDHKLLPSEELRWQPDAILETSVQPKRQELVRSRVEFPVLVSHIMQFGEGAAANPKKMIAYVGSRYERDDVIEQYLKPISDDFPEAVHFYGNWTREPNLSQCKAMWPNVVYHDRITVTQFWDAYCDAVACPLLAKRSYFKTGFTTPRIWEALMFGTIPVGFSEHLGIADYTPHIAKSAESLKGILERLSRLNAHERYLERKRIVDMLGFMDASNFATALENVVEQNVKACPIPEEAKDIGDSNE